MAEWLIYLTFKHLILNSAVMGSNPSYSNICDSLKVSYDFPLAVEMAI